MGTISENLQTIKDSTDAIKQAIIDKGGTISGDITTWADAILNIPTAPQLTENKISFTSSGCTAQYPVASDLTISVFGRPADATSTSLPLDFDIYIPMGTTTSTATNSIFEIVNISPSHDSTYFYTH